MQPVIMDLTAGVPEARMLAEGESGLIVDFGNVIDETVNTHVRTLASLLAESSVEGILEIVPAYRSLLVCFDPLVVGRRRLLEVVADLLPACASFEVPFRHQARVVNVPVCYGGEFGPDIHYVAEHCGLTVGEVVTAHSGPLYLVYMLGFTPGFPYLGGMAARLATPRLEVPRVRTPAGSVGIADRQTGIYSIASPGGWRIIGRTPLKLFDPHGERPFLFEAGDRLRFIPVGEAECREIRSQIDEGVYRPSVELLGIGEAE